MYDIPDYNFRDVIEMSFWMLSFLEKFEKEFEESQKRIAQGFITHNTHDSQCIYENHPQNLARLARRKAKTSAPACLGSTLGG